MTARIIWIGKNSQMAVTPRSASSAGATAAARPSLLPDDGRAAPSLQPRNSSPRRGNLARSHIGNAAPLFDATAERWIVPPSTIMVDAVDAADQRQPQKRKALQSSRLKFITQPSPAVSPKSAGRLLAQALEVFTVALGLAVFGAIAGVFLVMA